MTQKSAVIAAATLLSAVNDVLEYLRSLHRDFASPLEEGEEYDQDAIEKGIRHEIAKLEEAKAKVLNDPGCAAS